MSWSSTTLSAGPGTTFLGPSSSSSFLAKVLMALGSIHTLYTTQVWRCWILTPGSMSVERSSLLGMGMVVTGRLATWLVLSDGGTFRFPTPGICCQSSRFRRCCLQKLSCDKDSGLPVILLGASYRIPGHGAWEEGYPANGSSLKPSWLPLPWPLKG